MKAVGLDTSVVVRLLVGEPEHQALAAKAFIEKCYLEGTGICISDMVVAEAYHALIYHYEVPKREAVQALLNCLSSPMITATGHALAVLGEYRGTDAGLADRLIRMDLLNHASELATFDVDFAKLDNVRKLSL